MTEFLEIGKGGIVTTVRSISQADLLKCPHYILVAEHYRAKPDKYGQADTCRCNDPDHLEMKEWGYEWDGERWTATDD